MNWDFVVIALYMAGMVGVGWWAKGRAKSEADFLVAGRRLGPMLYAGTMAALVMGGGATIGGIGRGYIFGISGMWLPFALGMGVFVVSLTIAPLVSRLKVYTVSQMLELRYGPGTSLLSGLVMLSYAFMIAVTSTIAYGAIFEVLFGLTKVPAVLLGGGIVVLYSVLGGMWSITLTDFVQFIIKTVGLMFILLPAALMAAGGFEGLHAKLPPEAFSLTNIGWGRIITFFIIFNLSIVVGQDVWQRIFTARSPQVAKWAGAGAGIYCFVFATCVGIIGMAAQVVLPAGVERDKVYAEIVKATLPEGLSGLVIAAALAAIMSVSSGTLIASATVAKEDIVRVLKRRGLENAADETHENKDEVADSRWYILGFGVLMILLACVMKDVVTALTIGSAIVVTGLFVPIIGGMVWKRGTLVGAVAGIVAGIVFTFGDMAYLAFVEGMSGEDAIGADQPVYIGMLGSMIGYVIVSLMTRPTAPEIMGEWVRRVKGQA
jgi:SSS family solute:Na+ symporter